MENLLLSLPFWLFLVLFVSFFIAVGLFFYWGKRGAERLSRPRGLPPAPDLPISDEEIKPADLPIINNQSFLPDYSEHKERHKSDAGRRNREAMKRKEVRRRRAANKRARKARKIERQHRK